MLPVPSNALDPQCEIQRHQSMAISIIQNIKHHTFFLFPAVGCQFKLHLTQLLAVYDNYRYALAMCPYHIQNSQILPNESHGNLFETLSLPEEN